MKIVEKQDALTRKLLHLTDKQNITKNYTGLKILYQPIQIGSLWKIAKNP